MIDMIISVTGEEKYKLDKRNAQPILAKENGFCVVYKPRRILLVIPDNKTHRIKWLIDDTMHIVEKNVNALSDLLSDE